MWVPLMVAGGGALGLRGLGRLMTPIGTQSVMRKPSLKPPGWLFGPAWTVIPGLAAWSAAIAWTASPDHATRVKVLILYGTNAFFHALWSPLFFRARRPDLALIEVVFLWSSLVVLVVGLWPVSHQSSALILPYLAWVSFASWLNSAIVRLNRPFA